MGDGGVGEGGVEVVVVAEGVAGGVVGFVAGVGGGGVGGVAEGTTDHPYPRVHPVMSSPAHFLMLLEEC